MPTDAELMFPEILYDSQLMFPEIAYEAPGVMPDAEDTGGENLLKYYRPLHQAAKKGDWEAAKEFFYSDPDSKTADITGNGDTVLDAAAWAGHADFIKELLEILPPDVLEKRNSDGFTALHIAAAGGNLEIVKALVEKNPRLTLIMEGKGQTPLVLAAGYASKEVIRYLCSTTIDLRPSYPFTGSHSGLLTCMLARTGHYDILASLIVRYRSMATTYYDEENLLSILAAKPVDFRSGSSLSLLEKCIYHLVPVDLNDEARHIGEEVDPHNQILDGQKYPKLVTRFIVLSQTYNQFWRVLKHLIPRIKHIMEEKLKHKYVETLIHFVFKEISDNYESQIKGYFSKQEIMHRAVASGIVEIVNICLEHFPSLLWIIMGGYNFIFRAAVEQRRVEIFNLMYEINAANRLLISSNRSQQSSETALHLVAKLAPPAQLKSIPCSALQMQRELQWFKALENCIQPSERYLKNKNEQTASELFTSEHEKLSKEAEGWMRETSDSCMVVSALIATVAFAAAFTIPGGVNNDKGVPIFLKRTSFTVFAISNASALFSSTTSILMFLSILTARYAEKDFLYALPKRSILGLASLFIAIVAMIVAFGSALHIMLSERWKWVYIPTTILGAIPVALFLMLQFPLFIQMVWSTFGPSIFCSKSIW